MEQKDFKIIKLDTSFQTPFENMNYDQDLLNELKPNTRIERFYSWQSPGITYSYKQKCPESLSDIDHSDRLTGGGIVFHSPGDIVFSLVGWNNDPDYGQSMKGKLCLLSKRIRSALIKSGITIDKQVTEVVKDLNFCSTYPTPFEIAVNNQKIVGLTIRQFKLKWLIQGIIHTKPTDVIFKNNNKAPVIININEKMILNHI